MLDDTSGIKEFSVEYFIISIYMLVRHISRHYVVDDSTGEVIRNFIYWFHRRWKSYDETEDTDLLTFSNHRQQGERDLEIRDMILRQVFFDYLASQSLEIVAKDTKRGFTESERISIYRKGKGLCQQCLREGKPETEARVSWSRYQADHVIPHAKGGKTVIENGELLCSYHNQSKGASLVHSG